LAQRQWLRALPTSIDGIPVRVMDDLATAERSRWEVWHELRHGRSVSTNSEDRARRTEFHSSRSLDDKKIVQVKWDERTEKWYPIALRLMIKLMTDANRVEFATNCLSVTVEDSADKDLGRQSTRSIRISFVSTICRRFQHYFEVCGANRFARERHRDRWKTQGLHAI